MKKKHVTAALASSLAIFGITGCEITFEPSESQAASTTTSSHAAPSSYDLKTCEQITKRIVSSSDRDDFILNKYYTMQFKRLIEIGSEAGDGEAPYLNYDFIGETQDTAPNPLSLGPAKVVGNTIHIPYVQVHTYPNSQPFTKTWVFVKENGEWRASDILTSGREQGNGSMFDELMKM